MGFLRVGSLNVNGFRDRGKQALFSELFSLKRLNVCFLQETHRDEDLASDWGVWFKGESLFSHGSSNSAGIGMIFSQSSLVAVLSRP